MLTYRLVGRAISLAGDELNIEQARKVFRESIGSNLPETYGFVGSALKYVSKEMGTMFGWFKTGKFARLYLLSVALASNMRLLDIS